ncbi:MAG: non-canonical purine NTP pyrophosphatase [Clostridiales bacterium]|nr:non-canonical purine NTP pyrophosphatase [Clostridiales bacterium]
MEILIGTTNPSKIKRFTSLFSGYDVRLHTLRELGITAEPEETGRTPEENALQKATFYSRFADYVICNDTGLYFDGLPMDDPRQPGLHVRSPQGVRLDDEEMIDYYSGLIRSLGGKVSAHYVDGYGVSCCGKLASFMERDSSLRGGAFYMVAQPAPARHPGWPLDSLSLNCHTGAYFVEEDSRQGDTEEEQMLLEDYRRRLTAFLVKALGLRR